MYPHTHTSHSYVVDPFKIAERTVYIQNIFVNVMLAETKENLPLKHITSPEQNFCPYMAIQSLNIA